MLFLWCPAPWCLWVSQTCTSMPQATPTCLLVLEMAVRCCTKIFADFFGAQFELCSLVKLPLSLLPLILRTGCHFITSGIQKMRNRKWFISCTVCCSWVAYDTEPSCGMPRDGGPFQVVSGGPICGMVPSILESAISPGTACLGQTVNQPTAGWKQAVPWATEWVKPGFLDIYLSSWGHAVLFPWKQTAEATCENVFFF